MLSYRYGKKLLFRSTQNYTSHSRLRGLREFSIAPFPMRIGYGLGSVISPDVIESMKEEAVIRGRILELEEIDDELESTQYELTLQKNKMVNDLVDEQDINEHSDLLNKEIDTLAETRGNVLKEKIDAYKDLVKFQQDSINYSPDSKNKTYHFTTFDSGVPSPVDWQRSTISYIDRANDSININAHFFDTNSVLQSSTSHVNNITSALQSESNKFGKQMKGALTAAAHHSATETMEMHDVESTLLIIATAFHRNVKELSPLVIDADQLFDCWNAIFPNDKLDMTLIGNKALTESRQSENTLGIITEEFLGSAMVGMVHFIKKEDTLSEQSADVAALRAEFSLKKTLPMFGLIGNASGISEQFASKAAETLSQSGIDVKFSLFCEGYLPKLESDKVVDAIKEFKGFSPDKMNANKDKNLFPDLTKEQNMLINDNRNQGIKQSHSGSMIQSTIMGLTKAYESTYKVLDYRTFQNAFDDYAKNVSKVKGCGVPCGMNVKTWNKLEVRTLIETKWSPDTSNPTGYGSGQLGKQMSKKQRNQSTSYGDDEDDEEDEEDDEGDEDEEDYGDEEDEEDEGDDEEEEDEEDYDEEE